MPDLTYGLFHLPPPDQNQQQLNQTPLEETNPYLANLKNFMLGIAGMSDKGIAAPTNQKASNSALSGEAIGALLGAPSLAITKFITHGSPDKLWRAAETLKRQEQVNQMLKFLGGTKDEIDVSNEIMNAYPRVTAQMLPLTGSAEMKSYNVGRMNPNILEGKYNPEIQMNLDTSKYGLLENQAKEAYNSTRSDPKYAQFLNSTTTSLPIANTFAHEFQHVGQFGISPEKNKELYDLFNAINYTTNPYEVAARNRALERIYGLTSIKGR